MCLFFKIKNNKTHSNSNENGTNILKTIKNEVKSIVFFIKKTNIDKLFYI